MALTDDQKAHLFRQRFYGRQDCYGRKWMSVREDGGRIVGYAPVCDHLWEAGCHLRLKDGIRCDKCEIKKYTAVSNETVLKHIKAAEEQIMYVLGQDDTVKFAAMDFDCKPGKEDKGYSFEDVKKASNILTEWEIPHTLARSTGNGYHLYLFFADFYPANKARALIFEVYERAGFNELLRLGVKPLPEVFPKQSYSSPDGIGNGIKPPMIEPQFAKGRNCLIDENNVVCGQGLTPAEMVSAQWDALSGAKLVTSEQVDRVIEEWGIPVFDNAPGAGSASRRRRPDGAGSKTSGWQAPLSGSIEKILEGCAAFRRVRDKALSGIQLGHQEGFALYHMCMRTSDGLDWFKANVQGWGTNDTELKQLEHSRQKDYLPWTCTKLQQEGICHLKTQCFNKKPPIIMVEGQPVLQKDLPVEQWPEPSPIRYAYGKGEDFLLKLIREADAIKEIADEASRLAKLKDLAYRAQVFDSDQQKELKHHIKTQKIAKPGELSKVFNEANQKSNEDLKKQVELRDNTINIDGEYYEKVNPFGYAAIKTVRNQERRAQICHCDITIEEERSYIEEGRVLRTVYCGKASAEGIEKSFEIDSGEWFENKDFGKYFSRVMASKFNVLRQNIDFVKHAAMGFSEKRGINKSSYLCTQGWYGESYLMPSVVVDKEGIKPNTEQKVDLSHKSYGKNLDFKLLNDDEFQDVMMHLKTEFLDTWPREWTLLSLPHAFIPAIAGPLGIKKKPTFFFEGQTGSGKTELSFALQHFYGDFDALPNLAGTHKGALELGYDFKDVLLVLDDFKGLDKHQIQHVGYIIQYGYDGSFPPKLKRDSTLMEARPTRSTIMASGENFPSGQSSMVARCVLLEVGRHDKYMTEALYLKCKKACKNYAGVTPRFIHWFLNQDKQEILNGWYATQSEILHTVRGRVNDSRISYNMALLHMVWKLWCDFMLSCGVITHKEKELLIEEQKREVVKVSFKMVERCEDEHNAHAFVRVLRQLIDAKEVSIEGLDGHMHEHKPIIGHVQEKDRERGMVNIYPDVIFDKTRKFGHVHIDGTDRSVARELIDQRIITEVDPGRLKKQVWHNNRRLYVWVMDMEKLGFTPGLKVVGSDTEQFRPGQKVQVDAEGMI